MYVADVHVNRAKDILRMSGSACGNLDIGHGNEKGAPAILDVPGANLPNGASNAHRHEQMGGSEAAAKQAHTGRGRIWTTAHLKAVLKVAQDEDCCFLEKQTNRDKEAAWRIFCERLRAENPSLFANWKLDRKQVRRRIMDVLRSHRSNEEVARRATGLGGGLVDDEFASLCDEMCDRLDEAEALQGDKRRQRMQAREDKELAGRQLVDHQLQTGGERSKKRSRSSSSPDDSTQKQRGRRSNSMRDDERASLIPTLDKTLVEIMRARKEEVASVQWDLRTKWHHQDPSKYPNPGTLEEYVSERVSQTSGHLTGLTVPTSMLDETEVESPSKEVPAFKLS